MGRRQGVVGRTGEEVERGTGGACPGERPGRVIQAQNNPRKPGWRTRRAGAEPETLARKGVLGARGARDPASGTCQDLRFSALSREEQLRSTEAPPISHKYLEFGEAGTCIRLRAAAPSTPREEMQSLSGSNGVLFCARLTPGGEFGDKYASSTCITGDGATVNYEKTTGKFGTSQL